MSALKFPKLKSEDSQQTNKTFMNQTTMVNLGHRQPIEISPSEVFFHQIQQDNSYEITVNVRNLTKKAKRIRVFQPKTPHFRCDYDIKGPIAAGLSVKLVISFQASKIGEFHDEIKIISEDNFVSILPIHAMQSQSMIKFDPFVNLGFIEVGQQKAQIINFTNEGDAPGNMTLVFDMPQVELILEPNSFVVEPHQTVQVKLTYKCEQAGIFRSQVKVKQDSFFNAQKSIDIHATSVEFNRFVINDKGHQLESINFDNIYYGTKKVITSYIVNNTPQKVSFKQKIRTGTLSDNLSQPLNNFYTPKELGLEQTTKIISCFPQEGIIDSYSQLQITYKCEPRYTDQVKEICSYNAIHFKDKKKIQEEFEYTSVIEMENHQPISIQVIGKVIIPDIEVSSNIFLFGECPVNQSRDIKFTIKNHSQIPIEFKFEKCMYFNIYPNQLKILSKGMQDLIASFNPRSAGNFQNEIKLTYNNIYSLSIKFEGTSHTFSQDKQFKRRGLECSKQDFQQTYFFVEQNNYEVFQKKKGSSYNQQTQSGDNQNTLTLTKTLQMYQTSENVEQFEKFIENQKNKNKYDNYIKNERINRLKSEQKHYIKQQIEDIQNQNMKISNTERRTQLEELPIDYDQLNIKPKQAISSPRLKPEDKKENLFVLKQIDKYQANSDLHIVEFKPDPTLVCKKKFHKEPKNHAEIRDCALEITGHEMQKINAGPNHVKFGIIFNKSVIQQTFWVRNDLNKNILVQLKTDSKELQNSYLSAQVIPPKQITGFDIVLQSQICQNYRGVLKYIINNKHEFQIQVEALIEPVKLILNKTNIKCIFTEENVTGQYRSKWRHLKPCAQTTRAMPRQSINGPKLKTKRTYFRFRLKRVSSMPIPIQTLISRIRPITTVLEKQTRKNLFQEYSFYFRLKMAQICQSNFRVK